MNTTTERSTQVAVYAIMSGQDLYLGKAYDVHTAESLLRLARMMGCSGVTLHGEIVHRNVNGEYSLENFAEFLQGCS